MALNMDCDHGFPHFLCRRCGQDDRSNPVVSSCVVSQVNGDCDEQIVAEHRSFKTIAIEEGVHELLEELVEKSVEITAAAMPTNLPAGAAAAGKGGEGGVFRIRMLSSSRRFSGIRPKVPLRRCVQSPATRI